MSRLFFVAVFTVQLVSSYGGDSRWPWSAESKGNEPHQKEGFLHKYFFPAADTANLADKGNVATELKLLPSSEDAKKARPKQASSGVMSVKLDSELQTHSLVKAQKRASLVEEMVALDRKEDVHIHGAFGNREAADKDFSL